MNCPAILRNTMEAPGDLTQVLLSWGQNPEGCVDQLVPVVYQELRKIAAGLMQRERPGHTFQPTVLIHEAYMRLVRQDVTTWKDRAHFFGVAAHIMRQVLVDYARQHTTLKRGGGVKESNPRFVEEIAVGQDNLDIVVDLDDALNRMKSWDPRKLEIVELHYFGGLKAQEISEALGLTLPTVRRDLLLGRAWLKEQFAS